MSLTQLANLAADRFPQNASRVDLELWLAREFRVVVEQMERRVGQIEAANVQLRGQLDDARADLRATERENAKLHQQVQALTPKAVKT